MPGEVTSLRDGRLQLIKIGPLGSNANNGYIIADTTTNDAIVVDAPEGSDEIIAEAKPFTVRQIIVTHRHPDHWAGIDVLRAGIDAPVFTHEADREPYAQHVSRTLAHGDEVTVGGLTLKIIHTPGHTPGCICLHLGEHLLSGDTLFPGGPGRTRTPEALQEVIGSITGNLYVLPDNTQVYPGHGRNTTIGESKAEYAVFAAKTHPADLCGDVNWVTS